MGAVSWLLSGRPARASRRWPPLSRPWRSLRRVADPSRQGRDGQHIPVRLVRFAVGIEGLARTKIAYIDADHDQPAQTIEILDALFGGCRFLLGRDEHARRLAPVGSQAHQSPAEYHRGLPFHPKSQPRSRRSGGKTDERVGRSGWLDRPLRCHTSRQRRKGEPPIEADPPEVAAGGALGPVNTVVARSHEKAGHRKIDEQIVESHRWIPRLERRPEDVEQVRLVAPRHRFGGRRFLRADGGEPEWNASRRGTA